MQVSAAAAWIWLAAPAVNPVIAVLVVVWMANLYNFMDGSDGLAGAMSVIGFGAYAVAGWLAASPTVDLFLALAASVFHFGEIRIPEAKAELRKAGIEVRL